MFDLIQSCRLLREQIADEKVVFGVNHEMRDFKTGRKKDLDLVIATPAAPPLSGSPTYVDLARRYENEFGLVLTHKQREQLHSLPSLRSSQVGSVLIALEAKATMTEHQKALPRLHDELDSSHYTVHGASRKALALGFVMVNHSSTFFSTGRNSGPGALVSSPHKQPDATLCVLRKVKEIKRRTDPDSEGFDGIGVVVVDMVNDGSPVTLVKTPPAPQPGDIFHYGTMISRTSTEYQTTFKYL